DVGTCGCNAALNCSDLIEQLLGGSVVRLRDRACSDRIDRAPALMPRISQPVPGEDYGHLDRAPRATGHQVAGGHHGSGGKVANGDPNLTAISSSHRINVPLESSFVDPCSSSRPSVF